MISRPTVYNLKPLQIDSLFHQSTDNHARQKSGVILCRNRQPCSDQPTLDLEVG